MNDRNNIIRRIELGELVYVGRKTLISIQTDPTAPAIHVQRVAEKVFKIGLLRRHTQPIWDSQ